MPSPWAGRFASCIVAAVFILATYGAASTQSKTQIADWLSQPELMLDTSVWLTIDVAFQICFCILAAKSINSKLHRQQRIVANLPLSTGRHDFPGAILAAYRADFRTAGGRLLAYSQNTGRGIDNSHTATCGQACVILFPRQTSASKCSL